MSHSDESWVVVVARMPPPKIIGTESIAQYKGATDEGV